MTSFKDLAAEVVASLSPVALTERLNDLAAALGPRTEAILIEEAALRIGTYAACAELVSRIAALPTEDELQEADPTDGWEPDDAFETLMSVLSDARDALIPTPRSN